MYHIKQQGDRIADLIREKTEVEVALEDAQTSALRAVEAAEQAADIAKARVPRDVFNYALALLSLDDQQRVYGYSDGLKGATSPTAVI